MNSVTKPQEHYSKYELTLGIILTLLQWVVPMNPLLEVVIWIVIAALSIHLVWHSHWTGYWSTTAKSVTCIGIVAIIGWQAWNTLTENKKPLQLVIRKFELLPLVDGKPILVNVVVNNLTSSAMAVKAYDVTAILDSPGDVEEEIRREDELFNSLTKALKEVKAISTDIPPSPPSSLLTLQGPALSSERKERLGRGQMTFYFLGALVHSGGTTFYCNYTQDDGVIKLCRKNNSPS